MGSGLASGLGLGLGSGLGLQVAHRPRVVVELPVILAAEQPLVDVLALAAALAARGREVGDEDAW